MTEAPVSPLRRRMIEDMTIRKFAPRTQEGYIRAIKGFSAFLGASPDTASAEDFAPLSAASGLERRRRANHQPRRDGAAVSLPSDAAQVWSPACRSSGSRGSG